MYGILTCILICLSWDVGDFDDIGVVVIEYTLLGVLFALFAGFRFTPGIEETLPNFC